MEEHHAIPAGVPRFGAVPSDLDVDFEAWRPAVVTRLLALRSGDEEPAWALPLATRLAALLGLARTTFGDELTVRVRCPSDACGQWMALTVDADRIPLHPSPPFPWSPDATHRLLVRLPCGDDQRRWRRFARDPALPEPALHRRIATSLVVSVDGRAPDATWLLPEDWLATLDGLLRERDPGTALRTTVTCPSCTVAADVDLDLEAAVLGLLAQEKHRLMADVDRLARAYHWSEAAILALSPARRRLYLERLEAHA